MQLDAFHATFPTPEHLEDGWYVAPPLNSVLGGGPETSSGLRRVYSLDGHPVFSSDAAGANASLMLPISSLTETNSHVLKMNSQLAPFAPNQTTAAEGADRVQFFMRQDDADKLKRIRRMIGANGEQVELPPPDALLPPDEERPPDAPSYGADKKAV